MPNGGAAGKGPGMTNDEGRVTNDRVGVTGILSSIAVCGAAHEIRGWCSRITNHASFPCVATTFKRPCSQTLTRPAFQIPHPSATSRIIITVKPDMAPRVARSVLPCVCDSGMSSSTTT